MRCRAALEHDRSHGHASQWSCIRGLLEIAAQQAACYSWPGQLEEALADLGSPQCQDCRDARRPISSERFLALSPRVVDGIDVAAIAEQHRDVGAPGAELDGMSWAA